MTENEKFVQRLIRNMEYENFYLLSPLKRYVHGFDKLKRGLDRKREELRRFAKIPENCL